MLPRTHQQWNDAETQNCIAALQKGYLVAVAWEPDLTTEHHSETSSSAYQSASSTSSRNGADNNGPNYRPRSGTPASVETTTSPAICKNRDLIGSKHYQRVAERLRALLSKYYSETSLIYVLLRTPLKSSLTILRRCNRLRLPRQTKYPYFV